MNKAILRLLPILSFAGLASLLPACASQENSNDLVAEVLDTYIRVAQAGYEDSLLSAKQLDSAIDAFLAVPTTQNLFVAKNAWIESRVPYQQTEAYRFGNSVVDDWEGRVNAWPLDEGLIDYTAPLYGSESDNNYFYTANVIANPHINIGGIEVDASEINAELLSATLHEIDGVESNVATGYHAIEFLLWGQDLNGTETGAGNRPATDYSLEACTGGNCDRRRAYLKALSGLLITDLEEMVANWQPGGAAYQDLIGKGQAGALATILTGMGSLAYGELAGERIRLGLLLNDPEEEHDCFSDNTHFSHYYDAKGIENVYRGEYLRINGELVSGAGIADLIAQNNAGIAAEMDAQLSETELAMQAMLDQAELGNTFDVLIGSDNLEGEAIISRIVDSLIAETHVIEDIITALGLDQVSIEGSDSLDNPSLVF